VPPANGKVTTREQPWGGGVGALSHSAAIHQNDFSPAFPWRPWDMNRVLQRAGRYAISPPVSTRRTAARHDLAERWQSGRMHRTRNAAWGQLHRGFESLPLRHTFHILHGLGWRG